MLQWNGAAWAPSDIGGGGGSLAALSDVSVTEGAGIDGFVLYWNNGATKWEAIAISAAALTGHLADLTDTAITSPTAKQQMLWDSGASKWTNYDTPYSLGLSITGLMTDGEVLLEHPVAIPFTLPSGLSGSYAKANTAATSSTTVDVRKNGSSIGSIVWAGSATAATFSFTGAVSFAAGDILQLSAPGTHDTTLADIGITLLGHRS